MSARRENWSRHVDDIIRSGHYTWIAEGLGGSEPREAMLQIMTDVMHICRRQGIPLNDLLAASRQLVEREEAAESSTVLN